MYPPISAVGLNNLLDRAVRRTERTRMGITDLEYQKRADPLRRVDLDSWKDITVAVGYGDSRRNTHFLQASRCR